jgi:hypothetical protein
MNSIEIVYSDIIKFTNNKFNNLNGNFFIKDNNYNNYYLLELYNYFIPYENLKFKYLSKNNNLFLSNKLLNNIIKLNAIIYYKDDTNINLSSELEIVKSIDEKKIKININPNKWNQLELDDSEVVKRNLISKSINWCFYNNKNIFKTNLYKVINDKEYVLLENMDINNYVEIIIKYTYVDGNIIVQKSKFLKIHNFNESFIKFSKDLILNKKINKCLFLKNKKNVKNINIKWYVADKIYLKFIDTLYLYKDFETIFKINYLIYKNDNEYQNTNQDEITTDDNNINFITDDNIVYKINFTNDNYNNLLNEFDMEEDIEFNDSNNVTALMIACENGQYDIVKLLLDNVGNIDMVDNFGNTAIMYALRNENYRIINLLLDYNANLDVINQDGNNLLNIAVQKQNLELIKIILNKNPDIFNRDSSGKYIFDYEIIYKDLEILYNISSKLNIFI